MAGAGDPGNIPELKSRLMDANPIVRYWAATAGIILGDKASEMIPELEKALEDELPEVRIAAAEALFGLDRQKEALEVFRGTLFDKTPETVLFTVNALQELGPEALVPALPELKKVLENNENNYVNRAASFALETIESL
jgi:HEAT repeat protein